MAKSISVAVADSEAIRVGFAATVTGPFAPVTVCGNSPAVADPDVVGAAADFDGLSDPPQPVSRRAAQDRAAPARR
jgi:hypothetical protein